MRNIFTLLIISFFGCNSSDSKQEIVGNSNVDSIQKIDVERPRIFPTSEWEITNAGIGIVNLGDPFDSLEFVFDDNVVDTLTMSSEGMEWSAKRINLGNGEWILAEGDYGSYVNRLHTNSTKYHTAKGTHVGQLFSEIVKSGENIGVDIDEGTMSIRLYDQQISISVDSVSERRFYESNMQEIEDIPKNARIDEIGIF